MRRYHLTGFVVSFALSAALPAAVEAADLGTRPAPVYTKAPVVVPFSWTGFYLGGHIGYGWADPHITAADGSVVTNHPMPQGFLGGGQVGFNWQTGNWVLGLEADGSWGNLDDTRTCVTASGATLSCRGAPKTFGTIDGRLGYAIDRTLVYAKGGAAWSHEDFTQLGITTPFCLGTPCTGSVFQWGWTVGGGLEYAFDRHWSAKVEYDFLDFDHSDTVTVSNGTSSNVFSVTKTIQTIQLGVNYRFY